MDKKITPECVLRMYLPNYKERLEKFIYQYYDSNIIDFNINPERKFNEDNFHEATIEMLRIYKDNITHKQYFECE